ncbi:MAG: FAD-dependent oxidoreductase [bacterium]|nr:FAD-dependent oxidoreductase [bacterium]
MRFKVKLLGKKQEAKGTMTFFFERPKGFSYLAGQYIYITLPKLLFPDPRGDTRHFTLSSSPTEDKFAITTRMREESGFKKTLDEMKDGEEVSISGPNGTFVLDNEKTETPQVMIAGGIGVTPYRSIIKYVSDKNLQVPIYLVYSNSIPEEIAFKEELDTLATKHPNIKVTYTITKPQPEADVKWSGLVGRIDETFLRKLETGNWKLATASFWVCGPPAMASALDAVLETLKVPYEHINSEKFTGY